MGDFQIDDYSEKSNTTDISIPKYLVGSQIPAQTYTIEVKKMPEKAF